jgi:hypothetical protein
VRDTRRINGQKKKIDRGPWGKGGHTFLHVGERQFIEPCKCNPIPEALKCFLQLSEPIFFYWRVSNHDGHVGRFRAHTQNILNDGNLINRSCENSVIRCKAGWRNPSLFQYAQQQWSGRK